MPTDRSNSNNGRPLKPTLATNRTAKTPVAPRLAPSVASAASAGPRATPRSNVTSTPRLHTPSQDDLTPVKPFISSNVTPRSSSRKSRIGVNSANSTPGSTPSTTPVGARPTPASDLHQKEQRQAYGGLAVNSVSSSQASSRPRSVVGGAGGNNFHSRAPLSNIYGHAASETSAPRVTSPRFFHADDARSQEPAAPPPQPQKKAPVFFYANGRQDESTRTPEVPSPPLSSLGLPPPESKFFHADSLSEARSTPPVLTPPPIPTSPEPWANFNSSINSSLVSNSLRPPSPSKENIHLSYRKGASQIIRPNLHSRPSTLSILSGTHGSDAGDERSRRRSSAASAVRLGHGKSASLSSIDSVASLKKGSSNDQHAVNPSLLHREKRIVSTSSIPESIASAPSPPTESLSGLPSPTNASGGQNALEKMNQLAANARRERKVLDLEISNSSLLAINRSLEKEVRKQKAELRRFRRMSRAGRFSAETPVTTVESFSIADLGTLAEMSDMSEGDVPKEEEEEDDDDDDPEYSSEESFDESAMSASALAERDEAHRLRDEKRLQLDLSKHRELLVDSQKMNQSLKRCFNMTEELIKDAQKALAYQVRVSDVQLGGRVLSSEDNADVEQDVEHRALLSPWTPPHRATGDRISLSGSERGTDRDSGVDLDGLKPFGPDLLPDISPLNSPLGDPRRPHFEEY